MRGVQWMVYWWVLVHYASFPLTKSVLSHQSSIETNDLRGQLPYKDLAREFA
jgi:hypothetical protein